MMREHLGAATRANSFILQRAQVPANLIEDDEVKSAIANIQSSSNGGTLELDIHVRNGIIERLAPHSEIEQTSRKVVDLAGRIVWPCLVDCHTHLDKTYTCNRIAIDDRSLGGAIAADLRDQESFWNRDDLFTRMERALQRAYKHGTAAIRTHLISSPDLCDLTWAVYEAKRDQWAERILLEAVSLVTLQDCSIDELTDLANFVAKRGGVLGCAIIGTLSESAETKLEHLFALATERDLALDFHADENLDPQSHVTRTIAKLRQDLDFANAVSVSHFCSLAVQEPAEVTATLNIVKDAELNMVALPQTNLFLQDRDKRRTPRLRGLPCLQEIRAAGIPWALASDNCRDYFNPYGDYDLLDILRIAALAGHLEDNLCDLAGAVTTIPGQIMGIAARHGITPNGTADLIIFEARDLSELLALPSASRSVIRKGKLVTVPVKPELHTGNK